MTTIRRPSGAGAALLLLPLLAACPRGGGAGDEAVRHDTTNQRWEDGLSAREVEAEARALSPEEAEAQGLTVDTTIHLEVQDPRDTITIPRDNEPTPPPAPPALADTLPPGAR
jgi:hypothetical protein